MCHPLFWQLIFFINNKKKQQEITNTNHTKPKWEKSISSLFPHLLEPFLKQLHHLSKDKFYKQSKYLGGQFLVIWKSNTKTAALFEEQKQLLALY